MLLLITVCLITGCIRILTVGTVTQIVKREKNAQNIKERRYKGILKKHGHERTSLMKIKTDCNCGF